MGWKNLNSDQKLGAVVLSLLGFGCLMGLAIFGLLIWGFIRLVLAHT